MNTPEWAPELQARVQEAGEQLAQRIWDEAPGNKRSGKWDTQASSIRTPLVEQFTSHVAARVATHILSPVASQNGHPDWGPRRFPSGVVHVGDLPAAVLSVAEMMDEVKLARPRDGKLEEAASTLARLAISMLPMQVNAMFAEYSRSEAAAAPSGGCLIAMVGYLAGLVAAGIAMSRLRAGRQ